MKKKNKGCRADVRTQPERQLFPAERKLVNKTLYEVINTEKRSKERATRNSSVQRYYGSTIRPSKFYYSTNRGPNCMKIMLDGSHELSLISESRKHEMRQHGTVV